VAPAAAQAMLVCFLLTRSQAVAR